MADFIATVYRDQDPVTNPIGSLAKRDPILAEPAITKAIGRFDPGFSFSYPGGPLATRPAPANPTDAQPIYDVNEGQLGAAAARIQAGDTVTWSRGGFDFSGVTKNSNEIVFPAGCLASLYAADHDYFAVLFYARLPAQADWNSTSTLLPFFCTTTAGSGYTSEADLLTIGQSNVPRIEARRQRDGASTVSTKFIDADATIFGKICQVFFCRTAAAETLSVRPLGGTAKVHTGATAADNTGDYSAKRPRFGVTQSFNAAALSAAQAAAAKWKLYDCSIFDLTGGGDPLTLDANGKSMFDRDHDRVMALIADSAARNGGVSQIYN